MVSVLATRRGGRTRVRIHQLHLAGILFTRCGDWDFSATAHGAALQLSVNRSRQWRLAVAGAEPTGWITLDQVAAHLTR